MCRLIMLQTNFQTEVAVADVKKIYIENIIKSAEKCNKIDAIVLFGFYSKSYELKIYDYMMLSDDDEDMFQQFI